MSRHSPLRPAMGLVASLVLGFLASTALASPTGFGEQASTRSEIEVDIELVLAVDVSFSMDDEEQAIQRQGYIEAIRSPAFMDAIKQGMIGRIALTYVEWGGADLQRSIVDWQLIESEADALAFADQLGGRVVEKLPRTSISSIILHAGALMQRNSYRGLRNVIDVSGDGPNNAGTSVVAARDWAASEGIIINGLPLMMNMPASGDDGVDVVEYYKQCVITGPGAFVVPVYTTAEFATAIRTKIIREIAQVQPIEPAIIPAGLKEPLINCARDEAQLFSLRP
jgi:hypothetical protein